MSNGALPDYVSMAEPRKEPDRFGSPPSSEGSSCSESCADGGGDASGSSDCEGGGDDDEPPHTCIVVWVFLPFERGSSESLWKHTTEAFMQELGRFPILLIKAIIAAIAIAMFLTVFKLAS